MSKRNPRVLVFDSGVGGFSVAACIHRTLPGAELLYVADNAGFPYGDQPEQVVIERCCSLIEACVQETSCDVIVIACNTASTVVLPHLRARTEIPVVGVVPAIKPASQCTVNRKIGVLATPATVKRPYLDELIRDFASDCEVVRLGDPNLVRWAEELVSGQEPKQPLLNDVLLPFQQRGVDTVVLGCTHYPLLLPWFRESLPGVKFWVDSGQAIARRVEYLLQNAGCMPVPEAPEELAGAVVRTACFSGPAPAGIARFLEGMGMPVADVKSHWPDSK
ncbi:Glutamate racemase [Marinobacter litoralis]|uniref:Glutamate racemase n=1 Tax=Marinobacter litoralis TaxID=187981 RepID=A0A3M2RJP5_9GAMM|nr:glutamate racemase [Marinobacter litoralis]RMJ05546.1 Glutamate racemase [Marinobacter litoralis]